MNNNIVLYIIFTLAGIFLLAGMFSYIMNEPLMHDENMYITAGYLLKDYALYEDFSFLQMPYLPMLYAVIYTITDTSYYVLTARLLTFVFMVFSSLLMYAISLRLSGDKLIALMLMVLFVLNEITIHIMGFAWNAVHSMTFALLGVYLFFLGAEKSKYRKYGMFLGGAAIAVAVGMKSYYVVMLPVFFLVSVFFPRPQLYKNNFINYTLPLCAGMITGFLPVLYYVVKDFELFLFNNLTFHFINELEPYGVEGMTLKSRIEMGLKFLGMPTNIVLFIGILFTLILYGFTKGGFTTGGDKSNTSMIALLLGLVLVTVPVPFIATPIWDHYFGLPVPFAILLIGALYKTLSVEYRKITAVLLVCLFPVVFLYGGPVLFERIDRLFAVEEWEGVKIHTLSHDIKQAIGPLDEGDKVATLNPVFLLDAEIPFHKEFSSGVFLYQIGDMIDARQRERYVTTSPGILHEFFLVDPPKALLIVRLQAHDYPFFEYAEIENYREHEKWFYGHSLYISQQNQ